MACPIGTKLDRHSAQTPGPSDACGARRSRPPRPSGVGVLPGRQGKIAFVNGGPGVDVVAINYDGSGRTSLTNTPGAGEFSPAFSPDGRKIAFASNRDGNTEIYLMNAD